MVEGKIN